MLRYRTPIMSLLIDGVELLRLSSEHQVSAVYKPGTEEAFDFETHDTLFATVVVWARKFTPEANLDRLFEEAELFHANEFSLAT